MAATSVKFKVRRADSRVAGEERERLLADPGFGRIFTEHMVRIRWSAERGWHDAELIPYQPLTMDPGTAVLHYAQAVFEGLEGVSPGVGRRGRLSGRRPCHPLSQFGAQARPARASGGDVPGSHRGPARR